MAKEASFSFYADLPTFQTTRHFRGFIENSTLYLLLTALTVIQIIALIIIFAEKEVVNWINNEMKVSLSSVALIAGVAIWLLIVLFSFVGYSRKIAYSHFPLMVVQVSVCFMSIAGITWFIWKYTKIDWNTDKRETNAENDEKLKKVLIGLPCCIAVLIFHSLYTYVIFCLWRDVRMKKKTDEFIKRQHMIDDVCEEMMWEEEEAQRYAEVRSFPMSGIYGCGDVSMQSFSECSTSICSAELTINTMYNAYQQDRRIVTFYDDDENCYF